MVNGKHFQLGSEIPEKVETSTIDYQVISQIRHFNCKRKHTPKGQSEVMEEKVKLKRIYCEATQENWDALVKFGYIEDRMTFSRHMEYNIKFLIASDIRIDSYAVVDESFYIGEGFEKAKFKNGKMLNPNIEKRPKKFKTPSRPPKIKKEIK